MQYLFITSQQKIFKDLIISAKHLKGSYSKTLKRYKNLLTFPNGNVKVLAFYTIKLTQIIAKWRKIRINIIIYKQRNEQLGIEAKDEYISMLKVISPI